jgi:putative YphP/YqiW family bacilliredoxin
VVIPKRPNSHGYLTEDHNLFGYWLSPLANPESSVKINSIDFRNLFVLETKPLRRVYQVRYPEEFIGPMRKELTRLGVIETKTPEEVDKILAPGSGTVMMVVNSMCGCAAGGARPGIALALHHSVLPDKVATVFAGGDVEATARVREHLKNYPPSSPSVALFQDGKPVFMLHRHQIEGRDPGAIASSLTQAFDELCVKVPK